MLVAFMLYVYNLSALFYAVFVGIIDDCQFNNAYICFVCQRNTYCTMKFPDAED